MLHFLGTVLGLILATAPILTLIGMLVEDYKHRDTKPDNSDHTTTIHITIHGNKKV